MKKRRLLFYVLSAVLVVYFAPAVMGGYSYSEQAAVRDSFPHESGEVIFEKPFGDKKILVWRTENKSYVKLLERKWGIFHRVADTASIEQREPERKMKMTWSASKKEGDRYDTLVAAETIDPSIRKVIVSNEGFHKKLTSLDEVHKHATVYVEMDVKNGYAAHYLDLPHSETGDFVFRGLDEQGNIVSVVW